MIHIQIYVFHVNGLGQALMAEPPQKVNLIDIPFPEKPAGPPDGTDRWLEHDHAVRAVRMGIETWVWEKDVKAALADVLRQESPSATGTYNVNAGCWGFLIATFNGMRWSSNWLDNIIELAT